MKHQVHTRMTEGGVFRSLLLYSLPLIAGNLMQQLYNTFDSIIVGNLVGNRALAAVGASGQIIYLLVTLCVGASTGAGILIATYYGAEDERQTGVAVHTALVLSALAALIITALGLTLSVTFLRWMDTPEEVLSDAAVYLRIIFAGTLFQALYNMAAGILNAVGNSPRSLRYLAVSSALNVALDLLFVGVFGLGIAGAAWATIASQGVSAALALRFLTRTEDIYRVTPAALRLDRPMAKRIIRLGVPTAIQGAVISFSNVLIQAGVNGFGTQAMAGYTSCLKVDGFNILPVHSFSLAASTFVGQNLGAGRLDRAKKGVWTALWMSIGYSAVTGVLLLSFAEPVLSIFGGDGETIRYGVICMRSLAPFYTLLAVIHSLAGAIRGSGKTVPPMVIILFSLCAFRIFWIRLIAPLFGNIQGVFMTYSVSFFIGAGLMIAYAVFGHWLPQNLREKTPVSVDK